MAWFKVDDGLHDHRKARAVRRSHESKRRDVAPFGLWVTAGSWSGANSTSGFVPTEVLEEWDDNAVELAARLVDAGLWWPTVVDGEPGFGFHDWDDRNPAEEVDSGRYGNHLRWHVKRDVTNPECPYCIGAMSPPNRGDASGESGTTSPPESSPVPTRPDPSRPETPRPAGAERFDDFWKLYPRKAGRGAAVRAWKSALKKADPDAILEALREQLPSIAMQLRTDGDFRPHPATWLNGERWTDDAAAPTQKPDDPYAHIPYVGRG